MGKLSIVTDSSSNPEKIKISVPDKKIYNGNTVILEGSLRYRPLHCSELYSRLSNRDWNKSETLFISGVEGEGNEDDPILRYRKYTNSDYKPTGEIDEIDISNQSRNLSFPLCGVLGDETKATIRDMYCSIFDFTNAVPSEAFMNSTKSVINISECQESIDLVCGLDSYTDTVSIRELIEYSSYPRTTGKVNLSIRYSKLNNDETNAIVYNYNTIFKAFEYTEDRELVLEDLVEIIDDNLIRLEYLGGIIRLFPISSRITECIINNCTVIYGNFTR